MFRLPLCPSPSAHSLALPQTSPAVKTLVPLHVHLHEQPVPGVEQNQSLRAMLNCTQDCKYHATRHGVKTCNKCLALNNKPPAPFGQR